MKSTSGIFFVLLFVLVIGAGVLFGSKYKLATITDGTPWVAVTLDNGYIYFGQLSGSKDNQYITITKVYFAQNAQKESIKTIDASEPQYLLSSLAKTAVYGPEDTMDINRDHVLFLQKLKADSEVVKTIEGTK